MSPEDAARLARADAEAIIRDANMLALDLATDERRIVVDGSMYAPSTRALTGASRVWDEPEEGERSTPGDLWEIYVDMLDHLIDEWSAPNGAYLVWDEGCLFVGVGNFMED